MARLHYSLKGFARALQMSSVAAFIFVEGELDKAFVDRLISRRPEWSDLRVLVRLAREVDPSLGEGKTALLELHTRLRRRNGLRSNDGKKILILLDKDIDDLTRVKRRCYHVVYTDFYNIENYLYRFTNLQSAVADAALAAHQDMNFLADQAQWAADTARSWLEWVGFCLAARLHGAAHLPNLGCESLIHNKQTGTIDAIKLHPLLESFANKTGKSVAAIKNLCVRQERRFELMIRNAEHDKVWNGKWYGILLTRQLKQLSKIGKTANSAFPERLVSSSLSHLDFKANWAVSLSERLRAAVTASNESR